MKKLESTPDYILKPGVGTYLKNLIYYLEKKNLKDEFYIYLMPEDYDKV